MRSIVQALNIRTRIFRTATLVDLAVLSDCEVFLEECCSFNIVDSFYGDIDTSVNFVALVIGIVLFNVPFAFNIDLSQHFDGIVFRIRHEGSLTSSSRDRNHPNLTSHVTDSSRFNP